MTSRRFHLIRRLGQEEVGEPRVGAVLRFSSASLHLHVEIRVGSRTGAVARRSLLGCIRGFPLRARLGVSVTPFPAPATSHVACGFPALRAPAHFTSRFMRPIRPERLPRWTAHRRLGTPKRARASRTAIPCSIASSRNLDAGTPCARWRRIFFSTQSRMYEKHRLEWPIAKYFTQPRRIGLIFSITPPTGWEREARKTSLSLPSKAVRFLPFGNKQWHPSSPCDSGHDGTQIQEIRSSPLAVGPPCGSSPHSPPLAVWPTPPGAASPPPAEAIAGADGNPPGSPDHRRTGHIRLPSTARAGSLLSPVPASCPPH